jgi:DNA-binding NarL/FixJ family response regulator
MKVSISSRELEIIRKLADGLTVQQIAIDLNVSEPMIIRSQKEIFQRTESGNIVSALQVLAREGFVLVEEKRTLQSR